MCRSIGQAAQRIWNHELTRFKLCESPSHLTKQNSCRPNAPDGRGAEQNSCSLAGSDGVVVLVQLQQGLKSSQLRYGDIRFSQGKSDLGNSSVRKI